MPENYQRYLADILFYMKYHGHYTFDEVSNMPVFYRDRQIEMLTKQLEKESGSKPAEGTDADLNAQQLKALREKQLFGDMVALANQKEGNVPPNSPLAPQRMPGPALKGQSKKTSKLKSPF
jgi:hypothetical protein